MSDEIIILLIKTFLAMIPFAVICFIYGWVYNMKLVFYLRKNYPDKYRYLYGDFLSGYRDSITSLYLMLDFRCNDEDDEGDYIIKKYKSKANKGTKFGFAIFMGIFLMGFIIAFISGI